MPCKNFFNNGECKFGDGCSFYHTDEEKRKLIDPLPNLPEGVTLPPMPEKLKHNGRRNNYYNKGENWNNNGGNQYASNYTPNPMIQITSIADLAALSGGFGGFNPNKYMTPVPMGFNNGFGQMPPHMMYQQQMQMQMYQQPLANGQPMPFGNQTQGNSTPSSGGQQKYQKTGSPNKNGQRYEKKDKNNSAQKSGSKKGDKAEPKKYVTKQKKDKSEDTPTKASSDKKPVENVASA